MKERRFRIPRKLGKDRKGAVAVEFGLVMPLFISMFMGMTEYSFVYFTYGSMQAATRDVTRQIAVNTLTPGQAQAEMNARLPRWAQNSVTVSVNQSAAGNPATNVYTLTTDLPIGKATPLSFFTKTQSAVISSQVEMKQELPFVDVGVKP